MINMNLNELSEMILNSEEKIRISFLADTNVARGFLHSLSECGCTFGFKIEDLNEEEIKCAAIEAFGRFKKRYLCN